MSETTQPTAPSNKIQRSGFEPTGVKSVEHVYLNHLIITDIADTDGQPIGASYNFDYTVLIQLLHAHGFNPSTSTASSTPSCARSPCTWTSTGGRC